MSDSRTIRQAAWSASGPGAAATSGEASASEEASAVSAAHVAARNTPLNSQSTTPKDLVHHSGSLRDEGEEARRVQLVEVTIDSLAEVGYVGTTLAEIARRAGVSPGLVAHYFDDKDGLLEAAFRTLA